MADQDVLDANKKEREEKERQRREEEAQMFARHAIPTQKHYPKLVPYDQRDLPTTAKTNSGTLKLVNANATLMGYGKYVEEKDAGAKAIIDYTKDGMTLRTRGYNPITFPGQARLLLKTAYNNLKDRSDGLVISMEGCKYSDEKKAEILQTYLREAVKLTPPAYITLDAAAQQIFDDVKSKHLKGGGKDYFATKMYNEMLENISKLEGNKDFNQLYGYGKEENYEKIIKEKLDDSKLPNEYKPGSISSGKTELDRVKSFDVAKSNEILKEFSERSEVINKIVSHLETTLKDQRAALENITDFSAVDPSQKAEMQTVDEKRIELIDKLQKHHGDALARIEPYIQELNTLKTAAENEIQNITNTEKSETGKLTTEKDKALADIHKEIEQIQGNLDAESKKLEEANAKEVPDENEIKEITDKINAVEKELSAAKDKETAIESQYQSNLDRVSAGHERNRDTMQQGLEKIDDAIKNTEAVKAKLEGTAGNKVEDQIKEIAKNNHGQDLNDYNFDDIRHLRARKLNLDTPRLVDPKPVPSTTPRMGSSSSTG